VFCLGQSNGLPEVICKSIAVPGPRRMAASRQRVSLR